MSQVLDHIHLYRSGRLGMTRMLNDTWALFEAAEMRPGTESARFDEAYVALTGADDARGPSMPVGLGSDEAVAEALDAFEDVVRELAELDP